MMTKLTKEQIEQERVKFEKAALTFELTSIGFGESQIKDSLSQKLANRSYSRPWIEELFEVWLARAELDKGE